MGLPPARLRPPGRAAAGLHQFPRKAAPRTRRHGLVLKLPRRPQRSGDQRRRPRRCTVATRQLLLYDAIYLASSEVMKPSDGRNAVVVFSDGLDRGAARTRSTTPSTPLTRPTSSSTPSTSKASRSTAAVAFDGIRRQLPGGGGGLYPGRRQPRWWPAQRSRDKPLPTAKKTMEEIARRTHGGRFFEAELLAPGDLRPDRSGCVDNIQPLHRTTRRGGYHKIVLSAGNKANLSVLTREGYYARTEVAAPPGTQLQSGDP